MVKANMTKILLITILSLTSFATSAMPPFRHIPNYANAFAGSEIPKEDAWILFAVLASFSLMVLLSAVIHSSYEKKYNKQ